MANCCDDYKHKDPVGHVHFDEGVTDSHDHIQVRQEGGDKVHVHLGFILTRHKYAIDFVIPNLLGKNVSAGKTLPKNVNLNVMEVQPTDSSNTNLSVLIHLLLMKEGLTKECFSLEDQDNNKLSVIVHARVLDKQTGTPMVKQGIHTLEVLKERDSVSDTELT